MPNIRTYCRYGAVLAAVAALLALGGCDRGKPSAKEGGNSVVAVGSQWYGHIPVWIGIERGIFRQHGFEVTWRTIGKSIDRLNAISSGEAQFASLGEIAMLSAVSRVWLRGQGSRKSATSRESALAFRLVRRSKSRFGKSCAPTGSIRHAT